MLLCQESTKLLRPALPTLQGEDDVTESCSPLLHHLTLQKGLQTLAILLANTSPVLLTEQEGKVQRLLIAACHHL